MLNRVALDDRIRKWIGISFTQKDQTVLPELKVNKTFYKRIGRIGTVFLQQNTAAASTLVQGKYWKVLAFEYQWQRVWKFEFLFSEIRVVKNSFKTHFHAEQKTNNQCIGGVK